MNLELLEQGLTVLCVGFCVVFVFLCILIIAMSIMGKVIVYINKIFPEALPVAAPAKQVTSNIDEEIAVAIAAVFAKR